MPGVVTLEANHYTSVALTVSDICGSGVSGTASVYANLNPSVYDVDLGAVDGPPFGVVQAGDVFSVPVRIQVCVEVLASRPGAALCIKHIEACS